MAEKSAAIYSTIVWVLLITLLLLLFRLKGKQILLLFLLIYHSMSLCSMINGLMFTHFIKFCCFQWVFFSIKTFYFGSEMCYIYLTICISLMTICHFVQCECNILFRMSTLCQIVSMLFLMCSFIESDLSFISMRTKKSPLVTRNEKCSNRRQYTEQHPLTPPLTTVNDLIETLPGNLNDK